MERMGIVIVAVLAVATSAVRVWNRFRHRDEMHFVFFADANRHLDLPPAKKRN